jgi:hypothetical protein
VFHPLTYEGNVEFNKIQDPISRKAIEIQVNEYGQTPKQLFKLPHPKRYSNKIQEIFIESSPKIINLTIKPEFVEEIQIKEDHEDLIQSDSLETREKEVSLIEDIKEDEISINNVEIIYEERNAEFNFDRSYTPLLKHHKK